MNRSLEVLLTLLALAGLYTAIPNNISKSNSSSIRAEKTVIVADGSDPMPLCRNRRCTQ